MGIDADEILLDPPLEVTEFYSQFGFSYEEWYPYKEELTAYIAKKFSLAHQHKSGVNDLMLLQPATVSPFNVYFTNKNLESVGRSYDSEFSINSSGLRSDEFSSSHNGMHMLFAGCSVTFGDGMIEEHTWPKKVYDRIASEQSVSGYYNIAIPGANHLNIYHQIFKYIELYGAPDVLFINFPDLLRTLDAGIELSVLDRVVAPMHLALELLCEEKNIKLIMFSWDRHVFLEGSPSRDADPHDLIQGHVNDPRLIWHKGFYRFAENDRLRHKMQFAQANKGHELEEYFFNAFDVVHPGIAEQDFYANFAYEKWKDSE